MLSVSLSLLHQPVIPADSAAFSFLFHSLVTAWIRTWPAIVFGSSLSLSLCLCCHVALCSCQTSLGRKTEKAKKLLCHLPGKFHSAPASPLPLQFIHLGSDRSVYQEGILGRRGVGPEEDGNPLRALKHPFWLFSGQRS